jgi:TonB-dependent receptor-like protein/carboxypeptidase-like protein
MSLILPAPVQTGTIAGSVIDDRTGQPISGVQVYVENQSSIAETDANGRFMMTVARGRQTITVSVIGYAVQRLDVEVADAPLEMTIRMLEGAGVHVERVTVAGSLETEADLVPGATSLHGRELETLRGAVLDDPLRALQALPSATATDDFYSEFAVRGSSPRHLGLVVDGVPTRYLMHALNGVSDGGSVAMINSDTLQSVTLLPGSYPQRTGRHAGAEIDFATREGRRDGFHGRAGLSGTSATFLAEGPIRDGEGSWLVSGRRSYLDYLIGRIDPDNGFAFGFFDAQTKATYDLNAEQQVSVTALVGRAGFEEGDPNIGANEIERATSSAWLASLAWRYLPSARFAVTQRLYSTGLDFHNRNRFGATLADERSSEFGWRADGMFLMTTRLVFEFGGDFEQLQGTSVIMRQLPGTNEPSTLNDYRERAFAASAYGQVRWSNGSRLSVTPGARIDRWSLTDETTALPWINGEIRVSATTRLRGGTGLYRQFPTLDQVHGFQGGGPALRPERALHVDAGVEHDLPRQTHVLFNVYARHENDILWTPGFEPRRSPGGVIEAGSITAPWVNVLSGTARGFEAVVRRDAGNGFSGWVGYAFGRLEYTRMDTGERFWADADQRHTLSFFANYRLSSRSSASARYRYGSNFPLAGYFGEPAAALGQSPSIDGRRLFYSLDDQRNGQRLPAYSRLDVRADRAFNWPKRRLVLFVEVTNVLNHENLRNESYTWDRAGRVFETTESLIPLVPSAGIVFEF